MRVGYPSGNVLVSTFILRDHNNYASWNQRLIPHGIKVTPCMKPGSLGTSPPDETVGENRALRTKDQVCSFALRNPLIFRGRTMQKDRIFFTLATAVFRVNL